MAAGSHRARSDVASLARRIGCHAWLASLTIGILALAPLLASFHRVSVRHAVCEHGDFIEPEPSAQRSPPSTDGVFSQGVLAHQAASTALLHGHTHCSVGIVARSAAGFAARAAALACPLPGVSPEAVDHPVIFARRILPSAPKTSPPATRVHVFV